MDETPWFPKLPRNLDEIRNARIFRAIRMEATARMPSRLPDLDGLQLRLLCPGRRTRSTASGANGAEDPAARQVVRAAYA